MSEFVEPPGPWDMWIISIAWIPLAALVVWVGVAMLLGWLAARETKQPKRPSVGRFGSVECVSERTERAERKEDDMDILTFRVELPSSDSGDVVKKLLAVRRTDTAEGQLEAEETREMPSGTPSIRIDAVQDSQVDLSLVAVDDAGNESDPVTISFLAADTIPPKLSGEMTVIAMGERTIEAPVAEADADAVALGQAEAPGAEAAAVPDDAVRERITVTSEDVGVLSLPTDDAGQAEAPADPAPGLPPGGADAVGEEAATD